MGALQGTAQNLGTALGVAIIGSLLLGNLTGTFDDSVVQNSQLPAEIRTEVATHTQSGLAFVPADAAAAEVEKKGVAAPEVAELKAAYSSSQVDALKYATNGVVVFPCWGSQ